MAKSGFAKEHLRSFIERVERLEEEKAALAADIKEIYAEAKGQGFDTKIMRKLVALRKLDTADLQEQEAMLDLYKSALGMLSDTPLGRAAIERVTPKPKSKLPPHDPETGEIVETESLGDGGTGVTDAAVNGAETSGMDVTAGETAQVSKSLAGDPIEVIDAASVACPASPEPGSVEEGRSLSNPRHSVTGVERHAPNYDLVENLPAFLRREKPRVLELA